MATEIENAIYGTFVDFEQSIRSLEIFLIETESFSRIERKM